MNGFLAAAIAHDATCEKGDEWVFHYMSVVKEIDGGKEEGNPTTEEELDGAKIECVVFCVILVVEIGFVIWCILTH